MRVGCRSLSRVCSALPRNAGEVRKSRTGELKLSFQTLKPFEYWVFVGLGKARKLEALMKKGQNGEARVSFGVGRESWKGLEAWSTGGKTFLAFFEKQDIFFSLSLILKLMVPYLF